jgi:hypothetical protein
MTLSSHTLAAAAAKLSAIGITIRKIDGEYRVARKGNPSSAAYFTSDLQDALDTGLWIVEQSDATEARRERRARSGGHPGPAMMQALVVKATTITDDAARAVRAAREESLKPPVVVSSAEYLRLERALWLIDEARSVLAGRIT